MGFSINKSLLKGGFILIVSFGIYNVFNFAFHFSMVRMMTVVDYGILASLFSIIYILAIFTESIQLVITKYTSGESNKGKLKNILNKSLKKSTYFSVIFLALYLIISAPLSFLLDISYPLMALNGLIIFTVFLSPVTRGVLQGTKRFKALGINMILESVIKLVFAIILVYLGFMVYGAIIGALIGTYLAFLLSFASMKDIIGAKEKGANTKGIYGYTKPAFITMFVIIAFYSIDVVIARIMFTDEIAGSYAVASTLAKTIMFGTQPVGRAMFPISADKKINEKKSANVFVNAMIIVILISIAALVIFYAFPSLIVQIFSGKVIPVAESVLFLLGISISLISITNLVLLYKLSIGNTKGYKNILLFLVLELVLLYWFSNDIVQFSYAFITASAIFLWGSIFSLKD